MDTSGRAPMWAVLPAAGAPAVDVLLRRVLPTVRAQLDARALAAIDEFMRQTELATRWQLEWDAELTGAVSVDGSAEAVPAETAGGSYQEIDPGEAAVLLKVTPHRVRQMCRADELKARQVGRNWLIDRTSVELRASGKAA